MKTWSSHALALAPALIASLALLWMTRSFVTDDAAITLRYSQHLAAGEGIRWNAGEDPVEGYTNFTQVLIGAAAIELGLPALHVLRIMNQLAVLLLSGIVYALGLRIFQQRRWAALSALFVGAHGPLVYWSTSGLETGLYVASVYAALWSVLVAKPKALWPALPCLLVSLTRFEGLAVVFVVCGALVLVAWRERSTQPIRHHLRWLLLFGVIYGAYFAWRYSYFGYLLSNSAYYKQSASSPVLLIDFVADCWPVLLVAMFAPFRRLGFLGLLLAGVVVVYFLGFSGVGRSVSYLHRFLLPTLPALALLALAALQRAWERVREVPLRRALVLAGILFVFGFDWLGPGSGVENVNATLHFYGDRVVSRSRMAAFIAEHFPAKYKVAVCDVGVFSYVLPNPIVDLFGLNDERYTHALKHRRRAYTRVVIAQRPELILLVSTNLTKLVPYYNPERFVAKNPDFIERYTWVHKVEADAPDYNYWLFARTDLPKLEGLREAQAPEIPMESSRAAFIDHLAQRIRARANGAERAR